MTLYRRFGAQVTVVEMAPRLIARVLGREHPHAIMERVSHETIYQALYVQTRGTLRADLHRQLSLKRSARKTRGSAGRGGGHTYDHAMKISQRPAQVADRAVPVVVGDRLGPSFGILELSAVIGASVHERQRDTIVADVPRPVEIALRIHVS